MTDYPRPLAQHSSPCLLGRIFDGNPCSCDRSSRGTVAVRITESGLARLAEMERERGKEEEFRG